MLGGKVVKAAQTIPALDQAPNLLVVLGAVSFDEEVEGVLGIGPGLGHRDVVKMVLGLAQWLVPVKASTTGLMPHVVTDCLGHVGRQSRDHSMSFCSKSPKDLKTSAQFICGCAFCWAKDTREYSSLNF